MIYKNKLSCKCLYKAAVLNLLAGLIAVPGGLITARFTSGIVEQAIKANIGYVVKTSLYFTAFILAYHLILLVLNIIKEQCSSKTEQKFKIQIYDGFLENNLPSV